MVGRRGFLEWHGKPWHPYCCYLSTIHEIRQLIAFSLIGVRFMHLNQADPEIASLVGEEEQRIENTIDLIAAESHASLAVLEVLGSVLNTKTIEG